VAKTREEQKELMLDIALNVIEDIEKKIEEGLFPQDWDGNEIRKYLADKFAQNVPKAMQDGRKQRVKDYNNTVIINNL
jgi:hypothetical protein